MDYGLWTFVITAVVFALIGFLYTRKKKISVEEFVGSKNSLGIGALVATLFASGMGSWVLFGPAETALTSGIIGLLGYALGSVFSLWVFIYVGVRLRKIMPKGYTLTEFVLHRFGKKMYTLVLIVSIFYMIVALTAELTGLALAANLVFGIPLALTAVVLGFGVLTYTAIGGFKASVFTDKIQSWVIIPLFAIIFVGSFALLDGASVFANAIAVTPELFGFNIGGLELGITLIIAVIGAEFFNHGWWQRAYAGKTDKDTKKAFAIAGLLVFPVVMIAGVFGFFAIGTPAAAEPSVALFTFLISNTPDWIIILTMVLATALVMSSMDTLLNGIVGILAVDFVRIKPKANKERILSFSKWATVVLAIIGMLVASQGYSVLYLFLVADLVCVGILFPVFYGLYSKRYSGISSTVSSVAGILVGLIWFPTPDWSTSIIGAVLGGSTPAFIQGNLLWSFVAALVVPIIISIAWKGNETYDFSELAKKGTELTK